MLKIGRPFGLQNDTKHPVDIYIIYDFIFAQIPVHALL